jgi:hypothetical protein
MSKRMLAELDAMLDAYDVVRRADELRRRRVEDEGLAFLAGFSDLRGTLVRPVFEAAGAALRARGHGFAVHEEEFLFDADGKTREAVITLRIAPAGKEQAAPADAQRHQITFSTRYYNKTVCITCGAGAAGGSYGLSQIDARLVEDEVLKLVASIVRA